jgi:hypothetical protein
MPLTRPPSVSPIPRIRAPGPPLALDDPWDIVERFARDIACCEKNARNQLALEAVRDSLKADAVFWYPGSSGDAPLIAAACDLPAAACLAFARKLIDGTPGLDGRLLRSVLPPGPPGAGFRPHSVVLVRVSQTETSWMVAVNFATQRSFQIADLRIMALIRRILVNQRRHNDLTGRMTETLTALVQCLTTSIDAHLPFARGHSGRVARIAVALGKRMRLPASVLNDLYFASLVHDIGITSVPQSLLLKPDRLTDEEFAQVKTYPVMGDTILASIKPIAHLRPAVRHHHERYDGLGYPDGLAGDDIPLLARILSFADAFDAMRSPRPYRPALTVAQMDDAFTEGAGKQWDPCVIKHYLVNRPHFHVLCEHGAAAPPEPDEHYVVPTPNQHSSCLSHC